MSKITPLTKGDLLEVIEPFMASIANEFDKAGQDRSQLKTDVSQLKTDVSQLKTDVDDLKFDVSYVKNNAVTKSYLDDKLAD